VARNVPVCLVSSSASFPGGPWQPDPEARLASVVGGICPDVTVLDEPVMSLRKKWIELRRR
jgi:hypothetical protein